MKVQTKNTLWDFWVFFTCLYRSRLICIVIDGHVNVLSWTTERLAGALFTRIGKILVWLCICICFLGDSVWVWHSVHFYDLSNTFKAFIKLLSHACLLHLPYNKWERWKDLPNLSGYFRTIQAYFNNTNHPRRTALHSFGYTQCP